MHYGVKTTVIALLIIALAGCSASRKRKSGGMPGVTGDASMTAVIGSVGSYNITEKGFVIKRGRIEFEGTDTDGSFSLNARLNSKGDFFVSVRGPLGIELVRLLSVGNDIAMIDRFNRTVYVGKKDAVMAKNGLPADLMQTVLGDLPQVEYRNFEKSGNNLTMYATEAGGIEREITVCMDEQKVCRESLTDRVKGREIILDFSSFMNSGEIRYPSAITMNDISRKVKVYLSIDELVSGYDTDIMFNLPDYKRVGL